MKFNVSRGIAASAAVMAIGLATAPVFAHHQWGTYAWVADGTNPITPALVDNTSSRWNGHVARANGDWNASPFIQSGIEYGNNSSCTMVTGTIQVCNADYGANGWLGLATISLSNGKIVAGSTKLNDNYFNRDAYNNDTWRQLVTCQEIGHDYGLGHQDEDFSTDLTTSCMEYTNKPEGNEGPDFHDYEELARMYGTATTDGGGTKPPKGGGKGRNRVALPSVGNTPASWGRPTAFLPNGKPFRFERIIGNYKFVTHVTWVPDGDHGHGDHTH